ncbi:MAG: hypothetical protein AMXMBFR53_03920 [Gemmatimonadota bacterium]
MTLSRIARAAVARRVSLLAAALALAASSVSAQQVADSSFAPPVGPPAFPDGRGPRVALDEAHHNFHTLDGRYYTFGQLLADDGYDVVPLREPFGEAALQRVDVLVVANALSEDDVEEWALPNPSAFTPQEVRAVRRWVESGGGLLLIADHMPFPGAAQDLAAAFGFTLLNGFAMPVDSGAARLPMVFRRSDGSLADHPTTRGGSPGRQVDSVATFTGEALQVPSGAISLLTFPDGTTSLNPDTAWVFHEDTHRTDVSGWSQGAVLEVGRGRVAVFGEAAMFSAQLAGPQRVPMGMNAPVAARNPAFLLNLVRWLSGEGDGR